MMKRLFCLILAMMLLPILPAFAEENTAGGLELQELLDWAEGYKTRALNAQPLNDPTAPEALSEDGYEFVYEFATLYMDRPEMTEDSVLKNLVITAWGEAGPRNTSVDMYSSEVLAAYYNENENLAGDRDFAALYVSNLMPAGAAWAWVQRDGQRIMAIQYAVHDQLATGGEGYTDAGVVYTFQSDLVAAIRAYGLDAVIDEADVLDNLSNVQAVMDETGYVQFPMSYTGTDLTAFGESDVSFSGVDFLTLTPDAAAAALGECREDLWMEDDTGEHLRMMEFPGCEITFVYDAKKQNPRVESLAIMQDGLEGPRAVRYGDSFASVLNRFRHGEGEYVDLHEVLYGDPATDTYGLAEYGTDASATLRYAFQAASGQKVVLHMNFEFLELHEILLYFND